MKKRADGRYQKKIRLRDGSVRFVYGRTLFELEEAEKRLRRSEAESLCVPAVADLWWEETEPRLSPNTRPGYARDARRFSTYFSGVPVSDVTPRDVNRYISDLITERRLSRKTANNALVVASRILQWGMNHGYCNGNAAKDVEVDRSLPSRRRTIPADAELRKIMDAWDDEPPFGRFAYWLVWSGLRKGELLALTWEDVDLRTRTISVSKTWYSYNNRPGVKPPKTESGARTVPIPDALYAKIRGGKASGLIFPGLDGKLMTKTHFERGWARLQRSLGITATPHQLRHAYTTFLLENGVDVVDASAVLGHAQPSTTMDVYNDIRAQRTARAAESIRHLSVDL